jgi:hypothetical protein
VQPHNPKQQTVSIKTRRPDCLRWGLLAEILKPIWRVMLLAERRQDAAMAGTALSQINKAVETMRNGGNAPSAAFYEQQLPRARAIVARLRKR